MPGLSGPAWLVIIAIGIGYMIAPPIKHGVVKTAHVTCHVLTLGHKCKTK
jgi:hypothetical protein